MKTVDENQNPNDNLQSIKTALKVNRNTISNRVTTRTERPFRLKQMLQTYLISTLICAMLLSAVPLVGLAQGRSDEEAIKSDGGSQNALTETAFGLHTVTFDTLQGTVTINLPDDLAAGDSISGTVIAEAKGKTETERQQNQDQLNGLVVEFDKQQTPAGQQIAKWPCRRVLRPCR